MSVPTQLDWKVVDPDPVIRPGQLHPGLDDDGAGACHVVKIGDRYRMYYWGWGPKGYLVLMAETEIDRPNDWQPVGGALLEADPDADYVTGGPSFPFVYTVDDQCWLMIFGAWGTPRPDGKLANRSGLAISDDAGMSWRYHEHSPCIALDRDYDQSATGSVCVVRADDVFRMYYTSIAHYYDKPEGVQTGHGDVIPHIGVAYAESEDGIRWEKPLDDFMVGPRGHDAEPFEYINSKPFVIREGEGWRMWISTFGHAYRIRSLVSDDGLTWTRVPGGPDGDIGVGEPGCFDDHQRSYASVVRHNDTYRMWYTGNGFGATGIGYAEAPAP